MGAKTTCTVVVMTMYNLFTKMQRIVSTNYYYVQPMTIQYSVVINYLYKLKQIYILNLYE